MFVCVCECLLKMYPAMVSGDHEGQYVCMSVCVCVEDVSSYDSL